MEAAEDIPAAELPDARNAGEDLQHIEHMLAAAGVSPQQRQQSRGRQQSRTRCQRADSQERPPSGTRRRSRHNGRQTESDPVGMSSAAGSQGTCRQENDPAASASAQYNQPGPTSTSRAWHCEACDCFIPRQTEGAPAADQWQVHVSGIRHTRQVLSIRETGAPGSLLVSTFETIPAKEAKRFKKGSGGAEAHAELGSQLAGLQATAFKELLHHTGATPEYHRLSGRFSRERLQDAWNLLLERRFPRRFFRQLTCNQWTDQTLEMGVDPAMLAVLSLGMAEGRVQPKTLSLDVICGHLIDLPAIVTGLVLVVRQLHKADVTHLMISFASWGTGILAGVQFLGPVFDAMQAAFQRNIALNKVTLRRADAHVSESATNVRFHHAWQRAAQLAPGRARLAFLMALHPRAAKTPIAQLPLNLLSVILDRAAPLVPFITEVEGLVAQRYDSLHMPSMSVGDQQCSVLHLRTSDRQKPWLDSPAGLSGQHEIFDTNYILHR